MVRKRVTAIILFLVLSFGMACAETLRFGMTGEEVRELQEELIREGCLEGRADGVFGTKTEEAVRAFQIQNGLKADGVAGKKTQEALSGRAASGRKKGKSYFSNDYSAIEKDADRNRIKRLQKALITMKYLMSSADGIYGTLTVAAVRSFQKDRGLQHDGIAGEKTLLSIEEALDDGYRASNPLTDAASLPDDAGSMEAPDKASIELLHWYKDVKPKLKSRARIRIYEPVSGLSWELIVHSKGRHCDAEPATLLDTRVMLKAFGNKNTWSQKGVYVLLPDGRWTIGATHTAPHLKGYIKNNGFDGHLCVHFFRDMDECEEKDPNYGVSNQMTIRALWKKITGESVE